MTIIQPNTNSAWINKFLFALVALLIVSASSLVVLYVKLVNLDHGIEDISSQIRKTETENAELKDRIFSLFNKANLDSLAETRQLVKDREPQYLEVSKWSTDYRF